MPRQKLVYAGSQAVPSVVTPLGPDCPVSFNPDSGFNFDGSNVLLTVAVVPPDFVGGTVKPDAIEVRAYMERLPSGVTLEQLGGYVAVTSKREAVGPPGSMTLALPGLAQGVTYDFVILAEYPDAAPVG